MKSMKDFSKVMRKKCGELVRKVIVVVKKQLILNFFFVMFVIAIRLLVEIPIMSQWLYEHEGLVHYLNGTVIGAVGSFIILLVVFVKKYK